MRFQALIDRRVITPNELIFMTPSGLAPGQYTLMVRARFGQNSVRIGLFEEMLTVT